MTAILDGTNGLILDPSGQPINNVSTINSGYLYGNRVINGAQEIDQVNNGAGASTGYSVDMFGYAISQAGKMSFQQVPIAPAGLKNSVQITVVAQYSPTATDNFVYYTAIEGKDVIDFQLGQSGAATFTTSYWIKGSVAGTYPVTLRNAAANRSYVGTVTVTTGWTQVKVTLQGDITGTWATDNTAGLYILWDLGSGSNFNTTAGAWQAGNFSRTSGSVTFVNQVAGSTLNITGVDCRLGFVAPTYFERRANELQLAQRYFVNYTGLNLYMYLVASTDTYRNAYVQYPVVMRITPSVVIIGTAGITVSSANQFHFWVNNSMGNSTSVSLITSYTASARLF